MTAFAEFPDLPDTWTVLPAPAGVQYRPGPGGCGCNPSFGDSCPSCDGTRAEEREAWRDARTAERREPRRPLQPAEIDALWLRTLPPESRALWVAATRDEQQGAA